uniref:Small integral membrane protein 24-like n=1 Tax=Petromyzon marinus TaxID=7757 RepID=A0AAJ7T3R8_PETMA|nr:small integral membrane protein 24-like [Petromyzon marinus]
MAQLLPFCVALFFRTCLAELQRDEAEKTEPVEASRRLLPPWLQGLVAVIGFLFLVFVIFIVNKVWCAAEGEDVYADVAADLAVGVAVEVTARRHAEQNSTSNDVGQHKAFENATLENEEENVGPAETASTAF